MKIIHCIYSFNIGGTESMLVDIANEQAKTDKVTVIVINKSYQENLLRSFDKRVNVVLYNRKPHSRSIVSIIKLNLIIRKLKPDVIHLHSPSISRLIFMPRCRTFLTVHSLGYNLASVRRNVTLFAISDAVRENILKQGPFNVITVPNGIVIDKIQVRKNSNLQSENEFKIVQVARLDLSTKGQDILIKALILLRDRGYENIFVDFIGTGNSENQLIDLARSNHIDDKIHFLGLKSREYIYSHLKDYDLMCHPARCEGFGLTIAEAMAAKLPVLVSNEGGPFEIIDQGKLGYFFESENVEDCANKILEIWQNYSKTSELTTAARTKIEKRYSITQMVASYKYYYKLV